MLRALGVSAKMSVSQPADAAEQEADRLADLFGSNLHVARKCSACADEDQVQRKAATLEDSSAQLADALPALRESRPQTLPSTVRADFERFFDLDLSSVRVHAGSPAAQASASLSAQAFTRGRDIYFAEGQYQPHSAQGQKLLAHELTHIAQQTRPVRSEGEKSRSSDSSEAADGAERRASAAATVRAPPSAAIHRQWWVPLTRVGPALERVGPAFERVGPALERVGPSLERVGPALERVGPGLERVGPALERTGPGLDRISPEWRPWTPEGWRAPPQIEPQPGPAPAPGPQPWPLPWGLTDPFPPLMPQPQPQPQPQPEPEPDDEDPRCGTPRLPLTRVTFFPGPLGQGSRVKASPLSKCPGNTIGSEPDNSIYRDQFDCITAAGQRGSWVRAHLLHGRTSSSGPFNLHGPGTTPLNLIIADQSLNQQMRRGAEAPAIARVWGAEQVLWYESKVDAYSPGLDYFAQSITVDFGAYDTTTGTEGSRLGGGTFTLKRTPPFCPATPLAGAPAGGAGPVTPGVGGVPSMGPSAGGAQGAPQATGAGAPASHVAFQSTLQICYHVLESRRFQVSNGGLIVRLNANWFDRSGETEQSPDDCPLTEYQITLKKKGWIFDDDISTADLTVGRGETLVWRHLDPGDYTLYIESVNDNPHCCLQGDIIVSTFDAPAYSYTYDPMMMA